ncbi:MAG TPA: peptidoglycan recognition family protein [Streptosporangiaceae bacterium]|nr:peptidoglycan recognition family protein [Streptosporangiaceae bacterium]
MDAWLSRRALLGGTIGGGLLAAFELGLADEGAIAAEMEADAVREGIIRLVRTRRQWRARAPKRRIQVLDRAPDHIVIHHTATPNTRVVSLAHAYALSRQIQRFHMSGRGWNDIGQQLTISRGGHVMEGRQQSLPAILNGRHVVGAQTLHHNTHTIGIENEGTYTTARVPARLWSSLVHTCSLLCAIYGLNPYNAIVGHRDYNHTACPGDVLYARLPALRRAVAVRLAVPRRRRPPGPGLLTGG